MQTHVLELALAAATILTCGHPYVARLIRAGRRMVLAFDRWLGAVAQGLGN